MDMIVKKNAVVTRADLREAVCARCPGLSRREAGALVDATFEEIAAALVGGESVKLYGLGAFNIRTKRPRIGRNPKTGAAAPITARRVLSFKASATLIARVNAAPVPAT